MAARSRPLKLTGQGTPHRFRANNAANGGILNLQLDRFREVANINLYSQGPAAEPGRPLPSWATSATSDSGTGGGGHL